MVVSQKKSLKFMFLYGEKLEQQSTINTEPNDKNIDEEGLRAKIANLREEVKQRNLQIYGSKLDVYENQLEQLSKRIDRTEKKIDSKRRGLFHGKQERMEHRMDGHQNRLEELNSEIIALEHEIKAEELKRQAPLRAAIEAQKETLYVSADGKISNKQTAGSHAVNISGQQAKSAVAAFTDIQNDPKKVLDYGWDKTVTGGLMKYTNTTPKQAQIISTVVFFYLLRKGYTSLRDGVFKGSNLWTIAAVFAGSWMATGMNPAALVMAFKKNGIHQNTQKSFAELFDVDSMQYETSEKMQDLELQEGLADTFVYGLKDKDLINNERYYDKKTTSFYGENILADFKKDEKQFLVNKSDPQAPENKGVMAMIATLETYQASNKMGEINAKLSPYLEKLAALTGDSKFEASDTLSTTNGDMSKFRTQFEKAKSSYRNGEEKKIRAKEQGEISNKLKTIDPQGIVQCDLQKTAVAGSVASILNSYSEEDLNNPEKAAEAKRLIAKVPGVTLRFPKESEPYTQAITTFINSSDFNKGEYGWLRDNNDMELKKLNADFLNARAEVYRQTGSIIQLSTQHGELYLETEGNKRDTKIQLLAPSRTDLKLAGSGFSSLGTSSYQERFIQGAIVANIIAECAGTASLNDHSPFSINTLSKGIDYKKHGTTVRESLSPTKIHSVESLLPKSSIFRNHLKGLTDALNDLSFLAEGTKVIKRDDGKTTEITQPTIRMADVDLPERFKGIKNPEGTYYTATSSASNGVSSTDYGMVEQAGEAVAAVGTSISKARDYVFGGQPDKPQDEDYIQSFDEYKKTNPNTPDLSSLNKPGLASSARQKLLAETAPIKTYLYGQTIKHKEYNYAFTSLYGYLQLDATKSPKEYYDAAGVPNIAKRKSKLEEIKPGIGASFDTADGLKAKMQAKGYPPELFGASMFDDITKRYSEHCGMSQYRTSFLAQAENVISSGRTSFSAGTKKVLTDISEGTVKFTADTIKTVNQETNGLGGRILGGGTALRGVGKLQTILKGLF